MAAALPIVSGIGAVTSAIGNLGAGSAEEQAAEYNARLLERQAGESLEQAREEERMFRVSARKHLGDQRANVAASGITQEGSAADVLAESTANLEADALKIRQAGDRRARDLRDDAKITRLGGQAARRAGTIGAASSLLSGTSDILKRTGG